MSLTRIPTKKVDQAVLTAVKKLEEAVAALSPVLPLLPEAERATLPRVRTDFPDAARKLAVASGRHNDIVALTEYDAEAVVEDLDNVAALKPLEEPLDRLMRMLGDARLQWLAEAYVQSLQLYGVAKVRSKKDGDLAQTIQPLAEVFATPRRRKDEGGEK